MFIFILPLRLIINAYHGSIPFRFLFITGFKGGHHLPIFVDNSAINHRYQRSQFSHFIVLSISFPIGKPFRNNLLFHSEGQLAACPLKIGMQKIK